MKRVILTFEADEDLKKHLKEQAEKNKRTMSAYIRALLKRGSKYKEVLVAFLIFVSSTVFAGPINPRTDLTIVTFQHEKAMQLTIRDDMTIQEGFAFLRQLANITQNRIVVKDGVRYFRYGFTVIPMTYQLIDKKRRTIKKPIKL